MIQIYKELLDIGDRSSYLSPIIDLIKQLEDKVDCSKSEVKKENEVVAFRFFSQKANAIPIQFVFWINQFERVTFLIDDREILDDYLESNENAYDTAKFMESVLSNKIEKVTYFKDEHVVRKVSYFYRIPVDNSFKVYEDQVIMKSKFFWNKDYHQDKKTYESWLSCSS